MRTDAGSRTTLALVAMGLIASSAACSGMPAADLSLTAITPDEGSRRATTAVVLDGAFWLDVFVSYHAPDQSRLSTTFEVFIADTAIDDVTFVATDELTATVPAGLPVGTWDVIVRDPSENETTLADGFTILAGTSPCVDADGDGVTDCDGDCDDDPTTGASCTSGCATFYADADGDSYGDAARPWPVATCVAASGYVADATDCADLAANDPACNGLGGAACNPSLAGSDLCDGADNDCDPTTADGSDEPSLGSACDGSDADLCADGSLACGSNGLVCDDATDDHVEIVADGLDQDCDGFDLCYWDGDGDGFGCAVTVVDDDLDCSNASAAEADNADDCDDGAPTIFPGTACDDGDACTSGETCAAGACGGGVNSCCGDACGGVCSAEGCCDELCGTSGSCPDCDGGCNCVLTCDGGNCSNECNDDSTCQVTANGFDDLESECDGATCDFACSNSSGRCRLVCEDGADCSLSCNAVDRCLIACHPGSSCLLSCNDVSDCSLNECEGGDLTDCGGGVYACRRPCP